MEQMNPIDPRWEGHLLGGRYRIETLLGRGGMSSVFEAFDTHLKRKVAIKLIHPHLTDNPEFIRRFEQEAAAVAQLRHQHIVQVYDFNHEGDTYYMVMEYINGQTLDTRLQTLNQEGMHMPLKEALEIVASICRAAEYAHQLRMVHRDIKPANVMLNQRGEAILTDFGIAKILGGESYTATGASVGTATYMSPEQVRGSRTDHRSDIYSIGVMLFEILSGQPPFQGDSTFQIMLKHINEPIPDIRTLDNELPENLVLVLEKALAKQPANRFQTAVEMAEAVEEIKRALFESPIPPQTSRRMGRAASLWQQINEAYEHQLFVEALNLLAELIDVAPDFQQQRVQELQKKALDRLYTKAITAYQAESLAEATAAIDQYLSWAPDDAEGLILKSKIQETAVELTRRQALDELYQQATFFLNERNYQEALKVWADLQAKSGTMTYDDRLDIERRARDGWCATLYQEAIVALANEEPQKAKTKWQAVLAIDPNYPDSQQVILRANQQIQRASRRRTGRWVAVIGLIIALILLIWWLMGRSASEAVEAPTAVFTPISATTQTAQPTAVATQSDNEAASAVTPTTTPNPPTPTASPTATGKPAQSVNPATDTVEKAIVIQPASLFSSPDANATERAVVSIGDELTVIGRSQTGTWFYVQNARFKTGFIFGELVEWTGDFDALPIILDETPSEPTNDATISEDGGPVTITLYSLDGTEICQDGEWTKLLFIEGRGGNGRYDYYWNDELIAQNQTEGVSFEVSHEAAALIGNGRVVSGSGNASQELFIAQPTCDNE